MQLAYHYPLGTINDERALRRHEWDFTHVDLLFLCAFFLSQLESHVQRGAVCLSFALGFQCGQFRLANVIMTEIEYRFLVIALDRKNFLKNSLKTLIFPFGIRDVLLEKIYV